MTVVKICGITRPQDAELAAQLGADWLGINFWPRSRRWVNRERAHAVARAARAVRPDIVLVGVFVNQDPTGIADLADDVGLDRIQLHGDEPALVCAQLGSRAFKAVAVASGQDVARLGEYPGDTILVDAPSQEYGGAGMPCDWSLARAAAQCGKRIILAGGLTPKNVAAAIGEVTPWGVDVASGVESAPGEKDPALLGAFVAAAKGAR